MIHSKSRSQKSTKETNIKPFISLAFLSFSRLRLSRAELIFPLLEDCEFISLDDVSAFLGQKAQLNTFEIKILAKNFTFFVLFCQRFLYFCFFSAAGVASCDQNSAERNFKRLLNFRRRNNV